MTVPKGKVAVYFHINPESGLPFYVGIGVKFRPYRVTGRSKLWNRYVVKHGMEIKIVHLLDTWEEAKAMEITYIKQYGRIDKRSGILVNHTDGGDGALGCISNIGQKRTPEQRKKISDALKGRQPSDLCKSASLAARQRGFKKGPMSEEQKKRISESKKGIPISVDQKNKISLALKGRVFSEETKSKNSQANKGRIKSNDHKRKISDGVKRQWAEKRTWYYS
jgi:hypothetical protein